MKFFNYILALLLAFISISIIGMGFSSLAIGVNDVSRVTTPHHTNDHLIKDRSDATMQLTLTDQSMTFSSTRPISYYSLNKLYTTNAVINLMIASLLILLLSQIRHFSMTKKVGVLFLIGMYSVVSIHVTYWNWWGFSLNYSLGVSLSTLASIMLTGLLVSRLFFRHHQVSQS